MSQKILLISATILFGIFLLFSFPSLAQVNPELIPRIEAIKSSEDIRPAYRLVISQPQNTVYVFCPPDFTPELNYLRNVQAIQCKNFSIPQK